jgi:hypothetical protein
VGRKTQCHCGASVERQLNLMIEAAIERLQDEERIIHGV